MLRIIVTLLLLLLLVGGGAYLIDVTPTVEEPQQRAKRDEKPKSGLDEALSIQESLSPGKPSADGAPAFDVARIDPNGTSVFAGRAEPKSVLTITADGQEIGTVRADENGEWTFTTDAKIANPDAKLALFKATPEAVARMEEAAKPKQPVEAPQRQTAGSVTSNMLKNLEGMVAEARAKDQQPPVPGASPAVPPSAPVAANSAAIPSTTVPEPTVPGTAASTAPKTLAPVEAQATARESVPVPITFVFNEATLTSEGTRAASLLLEYLRLKRFPKVTLTGHADERGTDELNMNLSSQRLETVAQFLRQGGFEGEMQLVPKGKTEPFTGVVRSQFTQDDLWQLDRRVELVVSR